MLEPMSVSDTGGRGPKPVSHCVENVVDEGVRLQFDHKRRGLLCTRVRPDTLWPQPLPCLQPSRYPPCSCLSAVLKVWRISNQSASAPAAACSAVAVVRGLSILMPKTHFKPRGHVQLGSEGVLP